MGKKGKIDGSSGASGLKKKKNKVPLSKQRQEEPKPLPLAALKPKQKVATQQEVVPAGKKKRVKSLAQESDSEHEKSDADDDVVDSADGFEVDADGINFFPNNVGDDDDVDDDDDDNYDDDDDNDDDDDDQEEFDSSLSEEFNKSQFADEFAALKDKVELALAGEEATSTAAEPSTGSGVQAAPNPKLSADKHQEQSLPSDYNQGVLYLGRIPRGFEEKELRQFFSQFADVRNVLLPRSRKTGNIRHFAFIQLSPPSVADIVADSMDGYIMYTRRLVCKVVDPSKVSPEFWKRANRRYRPKDLRKQARQQLNKKRAPEQAELVKKRTMNKRLKRAKLLQQAGYGAFAEDTDLFKHMTRLALVERVRVRTVERIFATLLIRSLADSADVLQPSAFFKLSGDGSDVIRAVCQLSDIDQGDGLAVPGPERSGQRHHAQCILVLLAVSLPHSLGALLWRDNQLSIRYAIIYIATLGYVPFSALRGIDADLSPPSEVISFVKTYIHPFISVLNLNERLAACPNPDFLSRILSIANKKVLLSSARWFPPLLHKVPGLMNRVSLANICSLFHCCRILLSETEQSSSTIGVGGALDGQHEQQTIQFERVLVKRLRTELAKSSTDLLHVFQQFFEIALKPHLTEPERDRALDCITVLTSGRPEQNAYTGLAGAAKSVADYLPTASPSQLRVALSQSLCHCLGRFALIGPSDVAAVFSALTTISGAKDMAVVVPIVCQVVQTVRRNPYLLSMLLTTTPVGSRAEPFDQPLQLLDERPNGLDEARLSFVRLCATAVELYIENSSDSNQGPVPSNLPADSVISLPLSIPAWPLDLYIGALISCSLFRDNDGSDANANSLRSLTVKEGNLVLPVAPFNVFDHLSVFPFLQSPSSMVQRVAVHSVSSSSLISILCTKSLPESVCSLICQRLLEENKTNSINIEFQFKNASLSDVEQLVNRLNEKPSRHGKEVVKLISPLMPRSVPQARVAANKKRDNTNNIKVSVSETPLTLFSNNKESFVTVKEENKTQFTSLTPEHRQTGSLASWIKLWQSAKVESQYAPLISQLYRLIESKSEPIMANVINCLNEEADDLKMKTLLSGMFGLSYMLLSEHIFQLSDKVMNVCGAEIIDYAVHCMNSRERGLLIDELVSSVMVSVESSSSQSTSTKKRRKTGTASIDCYAMLLLKLLFSLSQLLSTDSLLRQGHNRHDYGNNGNRATNLTATKLVDVLRDEQQRLSARAITQVQKKRRLAQAPYVFSEQETVAVVYSLLRHCVAAEQLSVYAPLVCVCAGQSDANLKAIVDLLMLSSNVVTIDSKTVYLLSLMYTSFPVELAALFGTVIVSDVGSLTSLRSIQAMSRSSRMDGILWASVKTLLYCKPEIPNYGQFMGDAISAALSTLRKLAVYHPVVLLQALPVMSDFLAGELDSASGGGEREGDQISQLKNICSSVVQIMRDLRIYLIEFVDINTCVVALSPLFGIITFVISASDKSLYIQLLRLTCAVLLEYVRDFDVKVAKNPSSFASSQRHPLVEFSGLCTRAAVAFNGLDEIAQLAGALDGLTNAGLPQDEAALVLNEIYDEIPDSLSVVTSQSLSTVCGAAAASASLTRLAALVKRTPVSGRTQAQLTAALPVMLVCAGSQCSRELRSQAYMLIHHLMTMSSDPVIAAQVVDHLLLLVDSAGNDLVRADAFAAAVHLLPLLTDARAHLLFQRVLLDLEANYANGQAIVTVGRARFIVLTPAVIRLELAPDTQPPVFEDRATLTFVNRNLSVPKFNHQIFNGVLVLTTEMLKLSYVTGSDEFTANTLNITSIGGSKGPHFTWRPGMANDGNLLGTIRSLDELGVVSLNCTENSQLRIHNEELHCAWGLVSRSGWTLVDDTTNWCVTHGDDWWDSRNRAEQDWYFFGHGHDYKQALADFIQVAGKPAMFPRPAVGVMWSRWLNLDNLDVEAVIQEYERRGLPLSVYILDMDWHTKEGWGGYSFDRRLFPTPEATGQFLKDKGLMWSVNVHDDDGIRFTETTYKQMAHALGLNPDSQQTIPFSIVNQTYVLALEDIALKNVENQGVDFYWIDWQQGGTQGGAAGGWQNPTFWLNKVRCTDHLRRNEPRRGMVLARFGGLGSHRYPVGFSGDVAQVSWANLAFQPYFTLTSSNVAYGWWSHDLVGPSNDNELYVRWIQWGAWSPLFRTHDRGMASGNCANSDTCGIVEVWNVPQLYADINRQSMRRRWALTPYIYTAARHLYDTGVSLIRPMYYDWPQFDAAYLAQPNGTMAQYMFGPDILVSPVTSPAVSPSRMVQREVWLPPGIWIEDGTGAEIQSPAASGLTLLKAYDLSEVPVFYRGGSVIPRLSMMQHTAGSSTVGLTADKFVNLEFSVYPGADKWSTSVYEDDGETRDYLKSTGGYAWISAAYSKSNGGNVINIEASISGSYPNMAENRMITFRLVNWPPLVSASVNGKSVSYKRLSLATAGADGSFFYYDGEQVTAVIQCVWPGAGAGNTLTVQAKGMTVGDNNSTSLLNGMKGGLIHSTLAKRNLDITQITPGAHTVNGGNISVAASAAVQLSYLADPAMNQGPQILTLFQNFRRVLAWAETEIRALSLYPVNALVQFYSSSRQDNVLCGTPACFNLAKYLNYQELRIEGYMPFNGNPNAIPLRDFWNAQIQDNFATTDLKPLPGYVRASYQDGLALKEAEQGALPLQVWWSEARKDMLTVASSEGVQYAKSNGYELRNSKLAYCRAAQNVDIVTRSSPQTTTSGGYTSTDSPTRIKYSLELLDNAFN